MSDRTPDPQTVARVTEILRTDLKLGPDAEIDQEMALIGGDHDLDSLDVLLLLTTIEKSFGVKIPNEAVREDAFTSVRTLACFIDERRAAASEASA